MAKINLSNSPMVGDLCHSSTLTSFNCFSTAAHVQDFSSQVSVHYAKTLPLFLVNNKQIAIIKIGWNETQTFIKTCL
jgi:hypothetical protein